jgi:glycosyltransferase involved in cell wall biosynthesis
MYLAAGTPVIACNIPGFEFVKDFGAGILIDNYKPVTIKKAIDEIEANYEAFSAGVIRRLHTTVFDNHVQPYIQYLLSDET